MGKRNMVVISMETGGHAVRFECDSRRTGNGFNHHATMFVDNVECCKSIVHYINRTWEPWEYHDVCRKACDGVIESRKKAIRAEMMRELGDKASRGKYTDMVDNDSYVVLMNDVMEHLTAHDFERRW